MSQDSVPPTPQKQFRGRDWVVPGEARRPMPTPPSDVPPRIPGAPAAVAEPDFAAPRPRPATERDRLFTRYAELRGRLTTDSHDQALLAEAAKLAEDLSLTIEAIELWRDCVRIAPGHAEATRRLAALDRRAAATGETGAARAATYKPREQPPESPPFWTNLPSVLSYPFRGRGLGVFVGASLFFAFGEVLATLNVFFGWFVMLCLLGYLAAWQFDVISRTAANKDDPPEFPEIVSIMDSCVLPFLGFLGCGAFAFAPMLVFLALMIQGSIPPGPGLLCMAITFVPSAFVFPMTLTVRALTQSVGDAMHPGRVLGSIARVLPDYLLAFLSLAVLWFAWALVRVGLLFGIGVTFGLPTADAVMNLDYLRIVGWFIYTAAVWPLLLYVWCVQGHLLGCVYRQSYKRLAWFVPAGAETQKAKRLSAAVALAGAGGALLLAGGGWLTYALWPGVNARSLLANTVCPIQPGAEMTYYWESTDGPTGQSTYRFDGGPDGKLVVSASYVKAVQTGVATSEGSVGVIDAKTGTVLRGDGEESGLTLAEKTGRHSRFFGPRRGSLNSSYLNDWAVRGELRFKDTWNVWRVVDPDSTTELYFDKATGVLVGRKFPGFGFSVTEWLTSARGVAGIAKCPGAGHTFDTVYPHESGFEEVPDQPIDVPEPQPFGFPPLERGRR